MKLIVGFPAVKQFGGCENLSNELFVASSNATSVIKNPHIYISAHDDQLLSSTFAT